MGNPNARPELVFWFDRPPRAGAGAFRYIANNWGNTVFYLCVEPLSAERKSGGWQESDHGKAVLLFISEKKDPHSFVEKFVKDHEDAIFVCNGLRSKTSPFIKKYLLKTSEKRLAFWSERPGVYGNQFKKIQRFLFLKILYQYYALRYKSKIKVFLPLGMSGVKTFEAFGWKSESMFPFMYDPPFLGGIQKEPERKENLLRFLYVGRFARSTKGLDVLLKALEKIVGDNWRIDLVGGYGEYKDYAISWVENRPNAAFLGTWPSSEVSNRASMYDVCIVPSRFDGWNVVVNEAIRAGIGVIASDEAVSHELVEASGAGIVVPAGNIDALKDAIQNVIDNPGLGETWKARARTYAPRISSENVGKYFIEVLDYIFIDPSRPRPSCPWL